MKFSRSIALSALTLAAGIVSSASADLFTFTYTDPNGIVATGSLTANDIGGGNMVCTSGTISISSGPLAGYTGTLVPLGPPVTTSPNGSFNCDNILYSGPTTLDTWGMVFTDGTLEVNIWNDGGGQGQYSMYSGLGAYNYPYAADDNGTFVIDPAVPTPGAAALMGVGILASSRRRRV